MDGGDDGSVVGNWDGGAEGSPVGNSDGGEEGMLVEGDCDGAGVLVGLSLGATLGCSVMISKLPVHAKSSV